MILSLLASVVFFGNAAKNPFGVPSTAMKKKFLPDFDLTFYDCCRFHDFVAFSQDNVCSLNKCIALCKKDKKCSAVDYAECDCTLFHGNTKKEWKAGGCYAYGEKHWCLRRNMPQPTPKCNKPNMEYSKCGTNCPATCHLLNPTCTKQCVKGCFCKKGYVKNRDGKCILKSKCPKPTKKPDPCKSWGCTCSGLSKKFGTSHGITWGKAPKAAQKWWSAKKCNTYACHAWGCTCSGFSKKFGTSHGVTWGKAHKAAQKWWSIKKCKTFDCHSWGCTCQGMSNKFGTSHGHTWGKAPKHAQKWWGSKKCNTHPQINCKSWGCTCSGLSKKFGTSHGITWGKAHANAQLWWRIKKCNTYACHAWGCTCQGFSKKFGTSHGVTWGKAHKAAQKWWSIKKCNTYDCHSWGCTCQGMSNKFGTSHGHTWGKAPKHAQKWWGSKKCNTHPQINCKSWGCTCSGLSKKFGTSHGITWGKAHANAQLWWRIKKCNTYACHAWGCTCQGFSKKFGTSHGITWGKAPKNAQKWWSVKKCNTYDCSAWGCTCQGMSNKYKTNHGVTWGKAPKHAQKWWGSKKCNTRPQINCKSWGCTCQGFSKKFGTSHGVTWGKAHPDAKIWWGIKKCNTYDCGAWGCTCQGMSNKYKTNHGVTWGSAPKHAQAWWGKHKCSTRPQIACNSWGCTCQGFSKKFGTSHGVTWGRANADAKIWWGIKKCNTYDCSAWGCTCQGMSNKYGTNHGVTWGSAPTHARKWWGSKRCSTRPPKVNCRYSWGGWSGCNKRCGGGVQYRSPRIQTHPKNGGQACPGRQSRRCNTGSCWAGALWSSTVNANWWGSLDRKGWSTCPHGYAMTALYRNSCQNLHCIEMATCRRPNRGAFTSCYNHNVWHAFDRKGLTSCNRNYYMAGVWRNNCDYIYCIEYFKCCTIPNSHYAYNPRKQNWWSCFDRKGWCGVPGHTWITGLWRNSCKWIYCIEEAWYSHPNVRTYADAAEEESFTAKSEVEQWLSTENTNIAFGAVGLVIGAGLFGFYRYRRAQEASLDELQELASE